MRSLVLLLGFMVSLLACAESQPPASPSFEEGKHYIALDPPVPTTDPSKIEVTEVFWYGCGHCYTFESLLQKWKPGLADDVAFSASPAMWNRTMETHARAFYTAKALGVLPKLHDPLFRALNVEKKRLFESDEIAELFAVHGVDKKKFKKAFDSFGVTSQVKQAGARARGYQISGTPEMVVDGKYRVSARGAGSQAKMLEVVDFLIEKLRAERG